VAVVAGCLGLAAAGGATVYALWPAARAPEVLGTLPAFSLASHRGAPLTLDTLRGRSWIADFIFTRCGGACPAMTAVLARLDRELPGDVVLVSFTVDPEHDTVRRLAKYASGVGAGERWMFVTGAKEALYALATEGFKLAAAEATPAEPAPDGPFLHSQKLVLVDALGRIRGYFDSTDPAEVERLRTDLARIAR
jgi:protein SCO1/2